MKILECTNPKDACQLTYEQIKEAAIKSINIKGFECFFINLGQNIGYSIKAKQSTTSIGITAPHGRG